MGWIADRCFKTGGSLYDGGPKRKGPLRKIVSLSHIADSLFDSHAGWLECGHFCNSIFGNVRAVCDKCRQGLPKDVKDEYGYPKGD